jgi:hypothetical protein
MRILVASIKRSDTIKDSRTDIRTATSGVHRLASQICHNQLFRKKLQQNIQPMNSTKVSSLAAHNTPCSHSLTFVYVDVSMQSHLVKIKRQATH